MRQVLTEKQFTKHLSSIPQTVKVTKRKESLRNCHSQEELTETMVNNVMSYPGWDPETKKGY